MKSMSELLKNFNMKPYKLEIRNFKKHGRLSNVITSGLYRKFLYSGDLYFNGEKITHFKTNSTSIDDVKKKLIRSIQIDVKLPLDSSGYISYTTIK